MEKYFFKKGCLLLTVCLLLTYPVTSSIADDFDGDLFSEDLIEANHAVADPLEPLNRAFFYFNDKLYFWVLKPVSKSYGAVLPEDIRMCIGNAFHNILAPIRIVNNLLQGKIGDSGVEAARFLINTVVGAGGLGDPAKDVFKLSPKNEDLGQTFGKYGVGEGIYICWPILGPSNLRDSIGFIGDSFLNPLTYLAMSDERAAYMLRATSRVNKTSLAIDDYDHFIESTFDPYTAMRDFYSQSRRSKILDQVKDSNEVGSHSQIQNSKYSEVTANSVTGSISGFVDLNNIEKMLDVESSDEIDSSTLFYYSTNMTVESGIVGDIHISR